MPLHPPTRGLVVPLFPTRPLRLSRLCGGSAGYAGRKQREQDLRASVYRGRPNGPRYHSLGRSPRTAVHYGAPEPQRGALTPTAFVPTMSLARPVGAFLPGSSWAPQGWAPWAMTARPVGPQTRGARLRVHSQAICTCAQQPWPKRRQAKRRQTSFRATMAKTETDVVSSDRGLRPMARHGRVGRRRGHGSRRVCGGARVGGALDLRS